MINEGERERDEDERAHVMVSNRQRVNQKGRWYMSARSQAQ